MTDKNEKKNINFKKRKKKPKKSWKNLLNLEKDLKLATH
jgi:hypothetical protein